MQVNNSTKYSIIVGLLLFFAGCQKQLNKDEYIKYVTNPENGLRKSTQLGAFELSAMYEPADYLVSKGNDTLTKADYEKFEHFQFRIKLIDGGNILLYNENQQTNEVTRINHFGFSAKGDFKIYTATDTNQCKLVHFSRNYNLSPTIDLSLSFDQIAKDADWQLVYTDTQFNLGKVKFLFKKENLTNLPGLKK